MPLSSPKAYKFVGKLFSLPSKRTIRKWLGAVDCYPGLQNEAFTELSTHKGDPNYENATLLIDGMHLKTQISYDQNRGGCFGYVDFGGMASHGDPETMASESLVVMLVGMKAHWKLPIGYMLIKSVNSGILAGIVRESIKRAYEAGVNVRVCTMDGTQHNVSAFDALGCKMQPNEIGQMRVTFPHPHPSANYSVEAMLDPPHMLKLVRNMLAEYGSLWWPKVGWIKWEHIVKLHNLQENCGIRYANKLTTKHVNFRRSKMKVNLAVQVFSDSVSRVLKWAYETEQPGLEGEDVLATSAFLDLHNKLFDVLNSHSKFGRGYKAAIHMDNWLKYQELFREFETMYSQLETRDGKKLICSRRRTGPLGLIACIKVVENLFAKMVRKEIELDYLCCHKLIQDHLEIFFSLIRARGGWCHNPNPIQFMYSFRALFVHAGKSILNISTGNCISQDETILLTVSNTKANKVQYMPGNDGDSGNPNDILNETNTDVIDKEICDRCVLKSCRACTASIAYIAGFYTYCVGKAIKCEECKDALSDSEEDPCTDKSLILAKNWEDTVIGLQVPSGSLCKLLMLNEQVVRRHSTSLSTPNVELVMLKEVMESLDSNQIFPILAVFHS